MLVAEAGPDAPQKAREMVSRLRETCRLPAFVFNHGAEEKRKEYERLKTIVGGALLANAAKNTDFELMLKGVLKTTPIEAESDKKLLRAKGWL